MTSSKSQPDRLLGPKETVIAVGLPAQLKIDLVPGAEFHNYETFAWLGSLALGTAVGFWTGFISTKLVDQPLLWSAVGFSALAIYSGFKVFRIRSKMSNGRVYSLTTLDKFVK